LQREDSSSATYLAGKTSAIKAIILVMGHFYIEIIIKVLVIGGTGFVGSHTAKALIDAGDQVGVVVRSKS
jgi:hypothetical protein